MGVDGPMRVHKEVVTRSIVYNLTQSLAMEQ